MEMPLIKGVIYFATISDHFAFTSSFAPTLSHMGWTHCSSHLCVDPTIFFGIVIGEGLELSQCGLHMNQPVQVLAFYRMEHLGRSQATSSVLSISFPFSVFPSLSFSLSLSFLLTFPNTGTEIFCDDDILPAGLLTLSVSEGSRATVIKAGEKVRTASQLHSRNQEHSLFYHTVCYIYTFILRESHSPWQFCNYLLI